MHMAEGRMVDCLSDGIDIGMNEVHESVGEGLLI